MWPRYTAQPPFSRGLSMWAQSDQVPSTGLYRSTGATSLSPEFRAPSPSFPPTTYRWPPSTAATAPERRLSMAACLLHVFTCGSYLWKQTHTKKNNDNMRSSSRRI
ncbi:hypothetical protein EYF80_039097 [Liparis tanakae]|uniref:Uncharacterized protein n=1 Tax=Liparis tanakae TaxID=230148 RepID=A0A4Z2GAX6_9TELE|nr:hypothetical protein EYF80_039097 [Liparis tanakae]